MALKNSSSSKKNKKHKSEINSIDNVHDSSVLSDFSNNDIETENTPTTPESKHEQAKCVRSQEDGSNLDKSLEVAESACQNKFIDPPKRFRINVELDIVAIGLTILAICTRFYRLEEPSNIVFDELHFGKYIGMYVKKIFFFDLHPPLGKLLISGVAHLAGFDGIHVVN